MTDNIEILRAADLCLSKCGRPVAPSGMASVDIYAGLYYQTVVANQDTQQQPLEVSGETTFFLKAISAIQAPTLVYVQIGFPTGKNLQQALRQWNQGCGVGSNRYVLDAQDGVPCEPGTKIWITGDTSINNPGAAQSFSVLFEGAYRYYLKPGSSIERRQSPVDQLAGFPRIFKTANQNIMAPRWNSHEYPGPAGAEWYTYVSLSASFIVPSGGGGSNNKVVVPTENGYEFFLRRMYSVVTFAAATTGTPYIRIREGSGRKLTDDYVNLADLSGQALCDWWRVSPGRDIVVDLAVMDSTGTGAVTVQYFFEGWRRRQ